MKNTIWIVALVVVGAGCENKSDRIRAEAEAAAADHRRRAEARYRQVAERISRDVAAMTKGLREMPYADGVDLREHVAVVESKAIIVELQSALSAMCVSADIVGPGQDDGMSIGRDIARDRTIGLRDCGDAVAWSCYGDYFEDRGVVVKSCEFEIDNSEMSKPGFMLERRVDLGYGTLRMRITLPAS